MNIVEALHDPVLFGALDAFRDPDTWMSWRAFLSAAHGLPLDAHGLRLFRKHTGRSCYAPPAGGYREVVAITGRQSGKTRIAATLTAYAAATAPPCHDGEKYALLVAQDHRASLRAAFGYIRAAFESSPVLRTSIVSVRSDTIELESGVRICAYPCRAPSVRGLRCIVAVCDELAFFRSTENVPLDLEMLRAVRPTLATTAGRLIILSSPYGSSGALWDLHRQHFGKDESPVLVWQATAPEMNASLPIDYIERMKETDPEGYRSEVLGEFRTSTTTLLDPESLDACVADWREQPPQDGLAYHAFVDPSGGRRDAFTCAIGHRDDERAVVDALRAWPAPFNPSGVTAEAAELLRRYRARTVVGDRFGGEWPRESFRSHGIEYRIADLDRSKLYLELLAPVNTQSVVLPNDPELLRELRSLERRRGPSGRDRVDHRPGSHDDRANALAGVIYELLGRPRRWGFDDLFPNAADRPVVDDDEEERVWRISTKGWLT